LAVFFSFLILAGCNEHYLYLDDAVAVVVVVVVSLQIQPCFFSSLNVLFLPNEMNE